MYQTRAATRPVLGVVPSTLTPPWASGERCSSALTDELQIEPCHILPGAWKMRFVQ